jgi:N-acetylglutamate synthase-like GNAT family acetyltransferase
MTPTNDVIIEKASVGNAGEILALQKLAYVGEAEILNDFSIPPLHQTMEEVLAEFSHQIFFKVERESNVIGSVRCYQEKSTCYIGKLIVHPNYQNRGIGTGLLNAAENQFPEADRYELFTSQKSKRNLYLYTKCGYRCFKRQVVSNTLSLLFLEKINNSYFQPSENEH